MDLLHVDVSFEHIYS